MPTVLEIGACPESMRTPLLGSAIVYPEAAATWGRSSAVGAGVGVCTAGTGLGVAAEGGTFCAAAADW